MALTSVLAKSGLETQIAAAFDAAAAFVENIAIEHGRSASPEHTVHSIRVVEELRTAALGKGDKPKNAA
ncbi:hypothetical protein D3227_27485 [Mesorhizobium waimense]|uniref:Uncharacterized protein n=1 Tax=Mesorhizobium waimense TaxID=1300307 RepID=A0A3A5KHG0_9HYPH|nr:hypothetical protein [Mesorhizobium waimense]RJT31960.1 hypothetical protein D3227_27485 [Mesorhizobium waimense]